MTEIFENVVSLKFDMVNLKVILLQKMPREDNAPDYTEKELYGIEYIATPFENVEANLVKLDIKMPCVVSFKQPVKAVRSGSSIDIIPMRG